MILFNLDQITSITVYKKARDPSYTVKEVEKWIFPFKFFKKKIVEKYSWRSTNKEIDFNSFSVEDRYIENDVVYYSPHITIKTTDNSTKDFYLSIEEIDSLIEEIKTKNPNFIVIQSS